MNPEPGSKYYAHTLQEYVEVVDYLKHGNRVLVEDYEGRLETVDPSTLFNSREDTVCRSCGSHLAVPLGAAACYIPNVGWMCGSCITHTYHQLHSNEVTTKTNLWKGPLDHD